MKRIILGTLAMLIVCAGGVNPMAQPAYRLPDVKSMKHLTTSSSDHAPDIPGKETTMNFYSASDGTIFTIYSYRGRNVAFSTHSNSDVEKSYRVFMDTTGNGFFQEIGRGPWQLPAWAR
ncbi:MAG TPA: hypothetical protein VK463_14310 [Desulfomonilaceae bacterium]|nr:hypothetical protein [Desulfomonilaceae bacterium]